MPPGHVRRDARAFTLVEMLLGLAIFAMVAVGLYHVLGGALRLERKVRAVHALCQDTRQAFDLMAKDFENMIPYPFKKESSDRLAFEGRKDRMIFFIPADDGVQQIEYYAGKIDLGHRRVVRVRRVKDVRESFEPGEEGQEPFHLIRRSLPLDEVLKGGRDKGDPGALISGLARQEGARFRYGEFSKDGLAEKKVMFKDEWKDNLLPDVIRVEIRLDDTKAPWRGRTLKRDFFPVVKGPLI